MEIDGASSASSDSGQFPTSMNYYTDVIFPNSSQQDLSGFYSDKKFQSLAPILPHVNSNKDTKKDYYNMLHKKDEYSVNNNNVVCVKQDREEYNNRKNVDYTHFTMNKKLDEYPSSSEQDPLKMDYFSANSSGNNIKKNTSNNIQLSNLDSYGKKNLGFSADQVSNTKNSRRN